MIYLLYILHIVVCLFLILVVLLQQGKGADLSVFGGGSTQTAFGARGAATVLHKLTVASFIAFIVTTVGIAAFQGHGAAAPSVIEDGLEAEDVTPDASTPDAVTPDAVTPDEAPAADETEGEAAGDGDAASTDTVPADATDADEATGDAG